MENAGTGAHTFQSECSISFERIWKTYQIGETIFLIMLICKKSALLLCDVKIYLSFINIYYFTCILTKRKHRRKADNLFHTHIKSLQK